MRWREGTETLRERPHLWLAAALHSHGTPWVLKAHLPFSNFCIINAQEGKDALCRDSCDVGHSRCLDVRSHQLWRQDQTGPTNLTSFALSPAAGFSLGWHAPIPASPCVPSRAQQHPEKGLEKGPDMTWQLVPSTRGRSCILCVLLNLKLAKKQNYWI